MKIYPVDSSEITFYNNISLLFGAKPTKWQTSVKRLYNLQTVNNQKFAFSAKRVIIAHRRPKPIFIILFT